MSRATRLALIAGVVVVAVVLFIVLKPDDKSSSGTGTGTTKTGKAAIANIVVKNGKPVGGIRHLTFNKGDTVQFKVTSDVADEVHLHGYDLHQDVKPGHPVKFKFKATIDGEFEAELEGRKEQIISLKVNP